MPGDVPLAVLARHEVGPTQLIFRVLEHVLNEIVAGVTSVTKYECYSRDAADDIPVTFS